MNMTLSQLEIHNVDVEIIENAAVTGIKHFSGQIVEILANSKKVLRFNLVSLYNLDIC